MLLLVLVDGIVVADSWTRTIATTVLSVMRDSMRSEGCLSSSISVDKVGSNSAMASLIF